MRRLFADDMVLKIISIVVAVVMWLYVMNEQNPQVPYTVRICPLKCQI